MKIKRSFTLDSSPLTAAEPRWKLDLMKRINDEFHDQAVEVNQEFRAAALEIVKNPDAIYAYPAVENIVRNTPRYTYIKNITAPDGTTYDAEIDLLSMRVLFIEINQD